ncbi:MAG: hypothetical protein DDT37_01998 [Firmicutes bacterium]|nr:hypothetical protein [candidate division NPL-UPA2 bacterium]
MEKRVTVEYQGGQARLSNEAVDYMLAKVDGIELYAELPCNDRDDCGTYEALKRTILDQAAERGVSSGRLRFWFDEREPVAAKKRQDIER